MSLKHVALLVGLSVGLSVGKAASVGASGLTAELKKIEKKYRSEKTISAEFEQTQESALTHSKKTSYGKIWIKKPNQIRWETQRPDPNLLVSDGKTYWFYTPPFDPQDPQDQGEVLVRKASQVQSRLAYALLAGDLSSAPLESIKNEGQHRYVLVPKKGTAGTVEYAVLEVSPVGIIQRVILHHRDGNQADISLAHVRFGEPLKKELFTLGGNQKSMPKRKE